MMVLTRKKNGKPGALCCCIISISVFVVFMIGTNLVFFTQHDNHHKNNTSSTGTTVRELRDARRSSIKHGRQMQVYRRPKLKHIVDPTKQRKERRRTRHRRESSKEAKSEKQSDDDDDDDDEDEPESESNNDTPTAVSSKDKPIIILHVGPPKTGTTSIQCGLMNICDSLANFDHTYYLGKACWSATFGVMKNGELQNFKTHHLIVNEMHLKSKGEGVIHLKNRLKYHHARRNNLLLSEEALAWRFYNFKYLARMLKEWNTVISVSYRRYHEWIPSRYGHDYAVEYTNSRWPYERNPKRYRDVPTLAEYIEFELDGMEHQEPRELFSKRSKHMTISTIKRYMPHFQNFTVYPFHNNSTNDMVTNFICNGLPPEAGSNTCELLRNGTITGKEIEKKGTLASSNATPPGQMDALRLVREAIRRGWIGQRPPDIPLVVEEDEDYNSGDQSMYQNRLDHNKVAIETRRQLVKMYSSAKGGQRLQESADVIGYKPPLICMDDKLLDPLFRATLLFEDYLISEGYLASPMDVVEVRKHFNEMVEKRKFCDLDVHKVLENPFWEDFFTFLNTLDRNVKLQELRKFSLLEKD